MFICPVSVSELTTVIVRRSHQHPFFLSLFLNFPLMFTCELPQTSHFGTRIIHTCKQQEKHFCSICAAWQSITANIITGMRCTKSSRLQLSIHSLGVSCSQKYTAMVVIWSSLSPPVSTVDGGQTCNLFIFVNIHLPLRHTEPNNQCPISMCSVHVLSKERTKIRRSGIFKGEKNNKNVSIKNS